MEKKVKYIDGFSESAWKSLVVKSLRAGWLEGMEAAAERLAPSTVKTLLIAGLFEDVFPSGFEELDWQIQLIENKSYQELLSFETHHGRQYTDRFCSLEQESTSVDPWKMQEILSELYKNISINWLPPRVNNCIYTWYKIWPEDKNPKREVFSYPFEKMPLFVLDSHTYEKRERIGLLSGHYSNHKAIGVEVYHNGWNRIREHIKTAPALPLNNTKKPLQVKLF